MSYDSDEEEINKSSPIAPPLPEDLEQIPGFSLADTPNSNDPLSSPSSFLEPLPQISLLGQKRAHAALEQFSQDEGRRNVLNPAFQAEFTRYAKVISS